MKDQALRDSVERQRALRELGKIAVKSAIVLVTGLGLLTLSILSIAMDGFGSLPLIYLGPILLPVGIWIFASSLLGGLGSSSWRKYAQFKARYRLLYTTQIAPPDMNEDENEEKND